MLGAGATDIFIRYVISSIDEGTKATLASQKSVQVEVRATNVAFEQQAAVQKQVTAAASAAAKAVSDEAAAAGRAAGANDGAAASTERLASANQAAAASAKAAASAQRATVAAAAAQTGAMTRTGGVITATGKKLSGLTVPIAAVTLGSAKLAADFKRSMEMIHTQAGASQSEVDNLTGKVLNMGKAMNVEQGPQDLAKGLFHLESIGLRGAKAMDTLKVAADGAAVGQADLEDTATALGSAWLVNIKGAGDLHHVMGVLNATVGAGNTTMGELVQALGTGILPAAKQAGLSIKDTMGALAVFTDEGYQASSAAAQFSTALHFLYNPTDKARGAMEAMGLRADKMAADMHKPQGLLVALRDLKSHLEDAGKASDKPLKIGNTELAASSSAVRQEQIMGAILPGGRGRIMLTLLNQLDRYQAKLKQIGETSDNFSEDVAKTQQTASYKIQRSWHEIEASMVDLGGKVLPILVPVFSQIAHTIQSVVEAFSGLPDGTKKFIVELGLLAAGLGPVLRLTGGLISGLGGIGTAFGKLGSKIAGTTAANGELAASQEAVAATATQEAEALAAANAAAGTGGAAGIVGRTRGAVGGFVSRLPKAAGIAGFGYLGSQLIGNQIGGKTGSAFSSIGGGAAVGAGIGSLIPGVGTIVGGVGGAVVGGLIHFLGQHQEDVSAALLKTLNLGGQNIQLHVGTVTMSKEDQQKYVDVMKVAQNQASGLVRAQDFKGQTANSPIGGLEHPAMQGLSKSEISKLKADTFKNYSEAGLLASKAFQSAVESGAKYTDFKTLFRGFLTTLKDVPLAARQSAVDSMIAYAQGLNEQGRLPQKQLTKLVREFGRIYDTGLPGAEEAGKRADRVLAAALKTGKSRIAAQGVMQDLSATFAFIPKNITITADNANKQIESTLKHLRRIAQNAHGQEAADARDGYNKLLKAYDQYYADYKTSYTKTYTNQLKDAKKNYTAVKDFIVGTLRDLRKQAGAKWRGILNDALDAIQGVAKSIRQLGSKERGVRRKATKNLGDTAAGVTDFVTGLFPGNRKGGIIGFNAGGYVPSMVSPGEQIVYGNQAMTVPGPRVAADNTFMMLPAGAAVLTGHGQSMVAGGASINDAINYQMPHFTTGGWVQAKGNLNHAFPRHFLEDQKGRARMSPVQITNLATAAGFGNNSSHVAEIAHGESNYFPGVVQHDPGDGYIGYGLLQMTPHAWGAAGIAHMNALGGINAMLNPVKNIQMGKYLFDQAGHSFVPTWAGTKYLTSGKGHKGNPSATYTGKSHKGSKYSYSAPIIYKQNKYRESLLGGTSAFDLGYDAGEQGSGRPRYDLIQQLHGIHTQNYKKYSVTVKAKPKSRSEFVPKGIPRTGQPVATGHSVPDTAWNPLHKPIANWIIPYLSWASSHGWKGSVSSGWRSKAEGQYLWDHRASNPNPVAPPGTSNHEKDVFPGGAVDVNLAQQLSKVLQKGKFHQYLKYAGAKDVVHFSYPHGGTYRKGGVVGGGLRKRQTAFLNDTWHRIAPSFGRGKGSPVRSLLSGPINFDPHGLFVGMAWDPGKVQQSPELEWPTWLFKGQHKLPQNSLRQLAVHEMAHVFQDKAGKTDTFRTAEGGAQAFAWDAMDKFFGGRVVTGGDPYNAPARWVQQNKGLEWIRHGQFRPMAHMATGGVVGRPHVIRTQSQPTTSFQKVGGGMHLTNVSQQTTVIGNFQQVMSRSMSKVLNDKKGGLESLSGILTQASAKMIDGIRKKLVTQIRAGGQAKTINRMRAALDVLDVELGYRVGRMVKSANDLIARATTRDTKLGHAQRMKGIDPEGVQGLRQEVAATGKDITDYQLAIVKMSRAARAATKSGHPKKAAEIKANIKDMQDQVAELAVSQIEQYRNMVMAYINSKVDDFNTMIQQETNTTDSLLAIHGIDPSSTQGLGIKAEQYKTQFTQTQGAYNALSGVSAQYAAQGNTAMVELIKPQLESLAAQLGQTFTDWITTARQQIIQGAQDLTDKVQTQVQGLMTSLSEGFEISGVDANSSQGLAATAAVQQQVMAQLQGTINALSVKLFAAAAGGDTATANAIGDMIKGLQGDLVSTYADWVQTVRQQILQQAQEAVDQASNAVANVQAGQTDLGLLQQIAQQSGAAGAAAAAAAAGITGSVTNVAAAGTQAASQQSADYINTVVIPALQKQLGDQQHQLEVNQSQGADSNTLASITQNIGATQTAILQALLDAAQATAENTEPLKDLEGTLTFEYQGQDFTDLISVGVGA